MKKTLAAIAVLGAFAGSAFAADVQVYGRIDMGIQVDDWTQYKADGTKTDGTDWGMVSGGSTTSRVGIKGSEVISENLKIGFNLETELTSDTGSAFNGGFNRESVLWAETDYGTFYAGKIGTMWSDGGATNFWAGNYVAFGTGAGKGMAVGSSLIVAQSRTANRISYKSPTFGGFTAYAEYSFGAGSYDYDGDDEKEYYENTSKDDRPAAIGLNYQNGNFGMGAVFTYKNEASYNPETKLGTEQEDEYTINLGTSYDFGVAKVKLAGQYFKNADDIGLFHDEGVLGAGDEYKGYGLTLGADIPAWGGWWTVGMAYTDGESDVKDSSLEFEGYNAAAMYYYPLSKRTRLYAGVGYVKMEADDDSYTHKVEYESTKGIFGMAHYF